MKVFSKQKFMEYVRTKLPVEKALAIEVEATNPLHWTNKFDLVDVETVWKSGYPVYNEWTKEI